MRHWYLTKLVVLFLSLGLWSCAPYHHSHDPDVAGSNDFTEGAVVATVEENGEILTVDANEILKDPDRLLSVLRSYTERNPDGEPGTIESSGQNYEDYGDGDSDLSSLVDELQRAAAEDDPFPVQTGLSAGDAKAFVQAAALTLDDNGQFDESIKVRLKMKGKTHAYSYNDDTKGGYIENEVKYYIYVNNTLVFELVNFWSVGIRPGTYTVGKRGNDPNNPFPTIPMDLSEQTKKDIIDRNLQYKLYAEGTGIVVLGFFEDGVLLDRSHPAYMSTDESCIDWMFEPYPPAHFHELPELRGRCLGRCQHPTLYNSK